MKFKSRRDTFFNILSYGLIVCLSVGAILAYSEIPENIPSDEMFVYYFPIAIVIVGIALLISMFFFTHYKLVNGYLKYRSGIIYGKIKISRIREIIVGKTLRVGMKPATAANGLIIKYDKYEEIYISPDTNERFVEEILKLNAEITIIRYS